jgi:hypothetical protein
LHVVQRWLGHLTPTMTTTYAQTLAETAEAEFLRYRKLTSDGRETMLNPEELYDMLQLDQRTDRILPHGYCTLPPRQSCDRGNACLTCDKFVTDASFLLELRQQRQRTLQLIEIRQQAFTVRTGTPMSEDNIWLQGRRREPPRWRSSPPRWKPNQTTTSGAKAPAQPAPGTLTPALPGRAPSAAPVQPGDHQQCGGHPHRAANRPQTPSPRGDRPAAPRAGSRPR